MREERFGDLRAVVAGGSDGEGGGDGPLVVLLHGFGAPAGDLVPLWREVGVPRPVRFVFPAAPVELDWSYGGGRAWWMIDVERLQADLMAGRTRDLTADTPDGLPGARAKVEALLDDALARLAPACGQLLLGGFSQGAMLACDVALRTARPLAGLALLSTTFLAADEWTPLMPRRAGLPVLQSHGHEDPLLPFSIAERLRDALAGAGLDVTWVPFHGGHEIPVPVLDALGAHVRRAFGLPRG